MTFEQWWKINYNSESNTSKTIAKAAWKAATHEVSTKKLCYEDIRGLLYTKYRLPKYDIINFQVFCIEMYKRQIPLRQYNGRNGYKRPAILINSLDNIPYDLKCIIQTDNLGKQYICYPEP